MRVTVTPPRLSAIPGRPSIVTIQVTNTGTLISGHRIRVLGIDPAWASLDQDNLSLFPDATGVAVLTVTLPPGIPAGTRRIDVEVTELTTPQEVSVTTVELAVPAAVNLNVALDPISSTGGKASLVGVMVENAGNAFMDVPLSGKDDQGAVEFDFTPPLPTLAPGEQVLGNVRLRAPRPWFGNPVIRPYTVEAGPPEAPVVAHGAWVQRARFSRGHLALMGLLAAATVFAVVLAVSLNQVVSRSNADRDLALEVAAASQSHGAGGGTSSVAGTVSELTTGAPVAGVTVELFNAGDPGSPIVSTATDNSGAYSFQGLAAGTYKLRFDGAGFTQLWYPESLTPANAGSVDVPAGKAVKGVDIHLGGLPATISGQVVGGDPTGALLTLELPSAGSGGQPGSVAADYSGRNGPVLADDVVSQAGSGVPAIVMSETLDATGDFVLAGVPSPAVYDLVVTKSGYATTTQEVDLAGGESRSGVTIQLTEGNGTISGTVSSAAGSPLGGATISASDGTTTVNTVSQTGAGKVGDFSLANLPTPDSLTLLVSAGGFASQTIAVSLTADQQVTGISVVLSPGVGSISGTVTTPADSAQGGVTVTATNGQVTLTTVTLSTGKVGTYGFSGLSVPSTYTLTFSRPDLASQTRAISLQATGQSTATNVDASMTASTAMLSGVVRQTCPTPPAGCRPGGVGEVAVTLTSGTTSYQVTTASKPSAGAYEVDGIEPGTYTLSFTRPGGVPTSLIVSLVAGQDRVQNETLAPAALIYGTVELAGTSRDVAGAQITLYLSSQYPTVPLESTTTNAQGFFSFQNLDAPESYLVAVAYPAGSSPQETVLISATPGVASEACAANATGQPASSAASAAKTCKPLQVSS